MPHLLHVSFRNAREICYKLQVQLLLLVGLPPEKPISVANGLGRHRLSSCLLALGRRFNFCILKQMKVGLYDLHAVGVCGSPPPH
jgi:hypothetical protein